MPRFICICCRASGIDMQGDEDSTPGSPDCIKKNHSCFEIAGQIGTKLCGTI